MKKQLLMVFVKYGLGLGLLAWVMYAHWHIPAPDGQDVGLAGALARPVAWHFLTVAAVVSLGSVLLTFVRWYVLVRAQDLPFTVPCAMRLGMIGFYLNTFLPGSVGGDIIKAAFIARQQSRRTVAVTTVIMDRVIGLCGLVWLVTLMGGLFWMTGLLAECVPTAGALLVLETIILASAGLTAGSIVFWLLLGFLSEDLAQRLAQWLARIPKVGGAFAELWRAGWLYRCRSRSVGLAMVMAVVGHIGFVLVYYWSAATLNPLKDLPSLQAHFFAVPVGMAAAAGFPTPGGVGGGEFVFGWLYGLLGYAFAAGVLASLVQRCIYWILGLVGYLVYLRMRPALARETVPAQENGDETLAPYSPVRVN